MSVMAVGMDVRGWIDDGIVDVIIGDGAVGDTMNQWPIFADWLRQ